jgi:hypothetical protein
MPPLPPGEELTLVRCSNPDCNRIYRTVLPKRGIARCTLSGKGKLEPQQSDREPS